MGLIYIMLASIIFVFLTEALSNLYNNLDSPNNEIDRNRNKRLRKFLYFFWGNDEILETSFAVIALAAFVLLALVTFATGIAYGKSSDSFSSGMEILGEETVAYSYINSDGDEDIAAGDYTNFSVDDNGAVYVRDKNGYLKPYSGTPIVMIKNITGNTTKKIRYVSYKLKTSFLRAIRFKGILFIIEE